MKKLLGIMAVALLAVAWTCQAVDYNNHFYNQRVYRVAIGSGTAPSAADMSGVAIHNGEMVLNTDDDCLYIMHASNVYTKITAAGAVTMGSGFSVGSLSLANNKVIIGSSAGIGAAQTLSGLFSITTGGVASATTSGSAVTNATVGGAALTLSTQQVMVTASSQPGLVTNVTVGGAALSGVTTVLTNATVSGAALSGVSLVVTNITVTSSPFVYLDGASNIVTNTFVTAVTFQTGTAVVSAPSISLESGTPVVSAPSVSFQTGSALGSATLGYVVSGATVSSPTISLSTGSFVKP